MCGVRLALAGGRVVGQSVGLKKALIRLALCAIHLLPQAGEVKVVHLSRLRERSRSKATRVRA